MQIIFYFSDGAALPGLTNALKDFISIFDEITTQEGLKSNFTYLNFAAAFQNPLESYGDDQLWALKKVARRYDPKRLFQKQLVGGFKVSSENGTHSGGWGGWHQ